MAQKQLLQIEIIPWSLDLLKAYEYLQTYTVRCLTTILLNLMVGREARRVCEEKHIDILEVLLPLLSLNEKLITTRVLGTMYSLLATPGFKLEAKEIKLQEVLEKLAEGSGKGTNLQIQYVIRRLHEQVAAKGEISDEEIPEENETSELEESCNHEALVGETLLMNEFERRDEQSKNEELMSKDERLVREETESFDVPTAMQSKPKIPRTPIPDDKLEKIRKENELIRQSMQIRVNEEANIKKRKAMPENKRERNVFEAKESPVLFAVTVGREVFATRSNQVH